MSAPSSQLFPIWVRAEQPYWNYILPRTLQHCLNRGHQFNKKSLNGRGQENEGQSVMFAVPGAYHNTQGQWQPKKELKEPTFGQAKAYLHIRGTERNRLWWRRGEKRKGTKLKTKKEYRYASETEPGREGRIKTNRSCMRTGCCLSGRVMEKIIEWWQSWLVSSSINHSMLSVTALMLYWQSQAVR